MALTGYAFTFHSIIAEAHKSQEQKHCKHRCRDHIARRHCKYRLASGRDVVSGVYSILLWVDIRSHRLGASWVLLRTKCGEWDPCCSADIFQPVDIALPRIRHLRPLRRHIGSPRILLARHLYHRRMVWMEADSATGIYVAFTAGRYRVRRAGTAGYVARY